MKKKIIALSLLLFMVFSMILSYAPIFKSSNVNTKQKGMAIYIPDGENTVLSSYTTFAQAELAGYKYDHAVCTPDATVTYDDESHTVSMISKVATKCEFYFVVGKQTPTLAFEDSDYEDYMGIDNNYKTVISHSQAKNYNYNYSGDGTITLSLYNSDNVLINSIPSATVTLNDGYVEVDNCMGNGIYILKLTSPETSNYLSTFTTLKIQLYCLDGDTIVYVYDEKKKKKLKKKLKDIKPGDLLYTYNDKKQKYTYAKVKEMNIAKTKEIYNLYVGEEKIVITGDHPVYVSSLGYIYVNMLKEGFDILCLDGEYRKVTKIEKIQLDEEKDMYCPIFDDGSNSFTAGKVGIVCTAIVMTYLLNLDEVKAAIPVCRHSGGAIVD